jgi:hypothetical protein
MHLEMTESESAFSYIRATRSYLERHGKLGVEIICANSPQAKGRVERANGTLQDWLVKAMRLAGISSIDDANAFLPSYVARHNACFACAPANPRDVHRPLATHENVEAKKVWREERTVTASLALHFNKAMFILEPTLLTRSLARKRVHVCEFPEVVSRSTTASACCPTVCSTSCAG